MSAFVWKIIMNFCMSYLGITVEIMENKKK